MPNAGLQRHFCTGSGFAGRPIRELPSLPLTALPLTASIHRPSREIAGCSRFAGYAEIRAGGLAV